MNPVELVNLTALMGVTAGRREIAIGLLDGPVAVDHPDLQDAVIRALPGELPTECSAFDDAACAHGTFVAGILSAKRGSAAPAICPGCTLLVRPIFESAGSKFGSIPTATPQALATALVETVDAGARIINMSSGFSDQSSRSERALEDALDYAMSHGTIVVAAAGNQGSIGSSAITRHPWVIPVGACDVSGKPVQQSNLGASIGRHGLGAPGENVTSLAPGGKWVSSGGTSVAAPFVTGTLALLWSEFPDVSAAQLKLAMSEAHTRRSSVVPPLLDAWKTYERMQSSRRKRA